MAVAVAMAMAVAVAMEALVRERRPYNASAETTGTKGIDVWVCGWVAA